MKQSIVAGGVCIWSAIRLASLAHQICLLLLIGSSLCADEIRFNEHVRPILVEHCLQCHGPGPKQDAPSQSLGHQDDLASKYFKIYNINAQIIN